MKVREPVARPLDVIAAELLLSVSQAFVVGVLLYLAVGVWDERGVDSGRSPPSSSRSRSPSAPRGCTGCWAARGCRSPRPSCRSRSSSRSLACSASAAMSSCGSSRSPFCSRSRQRPTGSSRACSSTRPDGFAGTSGGPPDTSSRSRVSRLRPPHGRPGWERCAGAQPRAGRRRQRPRRRARRCGRPNRPPRPRRRQRRPPRCREPRWSRRPRAPPRPSRPRRSRRARRHRRDSRHGVPDRVRARTGGPTTSSTTPAPSGGPVELPTSVEPRAQRSPWAWARPPEWHREEETFEDDQDGDRA